METSKILVGYFIYLPITIALTLFVSNILFKNGRLFMIDIFKGKQVGEVVLWDEGYQEIRMFSSQNYEQSK